MTYRRSLRYLVQGLALLLAPATFLLLLLSSAAAHAEERLVRSAQRSFGFTDFEAIGQEADPEPGQLDTKNWEIVGATRDDFKGRLPPAGSSLWLSQGSVDDGVYAVEFDGPALAVAGQKELLLHADLPPNPRRAADEKRSSANEGSTCELYVQYVALARAGPKPGHVGLATQDGLSPSAPIAEAAINIPPAVDTNASHQSNPVSGRASTPSKTPIVQSEPWSPPVRRAFSISVPCHSTQITFLWKIDPGGGVVGIHSAVVSWDRPPAVILVIATRSEKPDPYLAESLRHTLRQNGYEVITCNADTQEELEAQKLLVDRGISQPEQSYRRFEFLKRLTAGGCRLPIGRFVTARLVAHEDKRLGTREIVLSLRGVDDPRDDRSESIAEEAGSRLTWAVMIEKAVRRFSGTEPPPTLAVDLATPASPGHVEVSLKAQGTGISSYEVVRYDCREKASCTTFQRALESHWRCLDRAREKPASSTTPEECSPPNLDKFVRTSGPVKITGNRLSYWLGEPGTYLIVATTQDGSGREARAVRAVVIEPQNNRVTLGLGIIGAAPGDAISGKVLGGAINGEYAHFFGEAKYVAVSPGGRLELVVADDEDANGYGVEMTVGPRLGISVPLLPPAPEPWPIVLEEVVWGGAKWDRNGIGLVFGGGVRLMFDTQVDGARLYSTRGAVGVEARVTFDLPTFDLRAPYVGLLYGFPRW